MNIVLMGQFLLGFLVVVAILLNAQLVFLGRRYRQRMQALAPFIGTLLRWLPVVALVMVAGGIALAESSLLSFQAGLDVNGLSWFVIGTCLAILSDLCTALALITLREALKTISAADDTNAS